MHTAPCSELSGQSPAQWSEPIGQYVMLAPCVLLLMCDASSLCVLLLSMRDASSLCVLLLLMRDASSLGGVVVGTSR